MNKVFNTGNHWNHNGILFATPKEKKRPKNYGQLSGLPYLLLCNGPFTRLFLFSVAVRKDEKSCGPALMFVVMLYNNLCNRNGGRRSAFRRNNHHGIFFNEKNI